MTQLMEQVIERLRSMPDKEQDWVARFLLNELEDDVRWSRSTAEKTEKLKGFIDGILIEDDCGKCEPLDSDTL